MILLDTHTLLWYLYDNPNLSSKAKALVDNAEDAYYSIATLWEIAIKVGLGKLKIGYSMVDIAELCKVKDIQLLQIVPEHLDVLKTLPQIHKDPFDRIIIAQAMVSGLTIITKDKVIPKYNIQTLW